MPLLPNGVEPDSDPVSIREDLLSIMADLDAAGINCQSCSGVCCTFVANSMEITTDEAKDILQDLRTRHLWNEALKKSLLDCISRFQLDRPRPGDGQRTFGRRRYTCPFFDADRVRCLISPAAKPLGCLAFNPTRPQVQDGEGCMTDPEKIQRSPHITPCLTKAPIPMAVLSAADASAPI